jgi:hypothetical protein
VITPTLQNVKDFVSKHRNLTIVIVVILLLIGSFLAGRYTTTPKVETKIVEKEVIKTVEVEKQVDTTKYWDNTNKDEATKENVHTNTVKETKPDGTVTEHTITDTNLDHVVKEVEVKYVDRVVTVEKEVQVDKIVTVEKTVKPILPDWEASIKVGASINNLFNPTLGSPLVIGLEVDRRVLGPFKVGVWGSTNTTFNQWQAGVSLGAEF